jgi:hypothetical protein
MKYRTFFVCGLAAGAALWLGALRASAQSVTYDFEDGTDQGFGAGFGDDASISFPIVTIGGSKRMEVMDTAAFQQAGRQTGNPADGQYQAMLAASIDETLATISYDWYIDTSLSPGNYGSFLQEVELNGTQLASGSVFSGTVSQTFAAKGFNIPLGETFFRLGLISNGDGTQTKVYFDNITISAVPEPASMGLLAMAGFGVASVVARRRSIR